MPIINVELRQRVNGEFTDIIHPATNVTIVEGLLDANGKLQVSLFPPNMEAAYNNITSIVASVEMPPNFKEGDVWIDLSD